MFEGSSRDKLPSLSQSVVCFGAICLAGNIGGYDFCVLMKVCGGDKTKSEQILSDLKVFACDAKSSVS